MNILIHPRPCSRRTFTTTVFTIATTYKLELDAVDDGPRAEEERQEAGEDDHRVKQQEEEVALSSWRPETQTSGRSDRRARSCTATLASWYSQSTVAVRIQ